MKHKPVISIIIPFHKRIDYLYQILGSLSDCAHDIQQQIEVIAVDSHTADKELSELEASYQTNPFIYFKFAHSSNNLAAKRNLGTKVSSSDYLVFIDDDCIPDKGFLNEYIKAKDECRSVFCGLVRFDLSLNDKNFHRFRRDLEAVNDDLYDKSSTLGITSARAMNFGISKELILMHNLYFDEGFTGYGWEDVAFFSVIVDHLIAIRPCKASVLHLDFTSLRNFVKKNNQSGIWFTYFLRKYPKAASKLTITKFFKFRYLGPFLLPFVFIIQEALLFLLTIVDNYSFLYAKSIYRFLYSVSFIVGFCLFSIRKKQFGYDNIQIS